VTHLVKHYVLRYVFRKQVAFSSALFWAKAGVAMNENKRAVGIEDRADRNMT
jgi:hypothetical protein